MKPDYERLNRRNVLKAIGGAGAAAAVGGGALLATTGPAAAQSFSITDTSLSTNDGQVSWVAVDVGGTLSWDGFDTPVDHLRFVSAVTIDGQPEQVLIDTTSDPLDQWSGDGDSDGWGGPGEYVVSSADNYREGEVHTDAQWVVIGDGTDPSGYRTSGLNIPDWTASLSVDTDGDSKTTTVEKQSTTYFYDVDGNPVGVGSVSDTAAFDVTVTNEQSTTSGSTSGTSDSG